MSSHLLSPAAELLATLGRLPTLAEVAAAAGVSRATVYRAFPGRDALADALRERGCDVPPPGAEVYAAVRAVVLERGFDGLTLDAVAERAGVSVPTLHRRFDGRDGLLTAFLEQLPPRAEAWRLPAEGAPEDVLAAFVARLSAWLYEDGPLVLAALGASPAARAHLVRLRAEHVGTTDALAAWLADRGLSDRPRDAARVFLGAVLGLSSGGRIGAETARWWARAFLAGVA